MEDPTQNIRLAMPVGLPPAGAPPADQWRNLESRMQASTGNNNALQVWLANEDAYSGLFTMTRGLLRYLPAGQAGPDGTVAADPRLFLKPWLWDHLNLRSNAAAELVLPKLISYGNLDPTQLTQAVRQEMNSSTRYQALSAAERTQIESDFMAGHIQLLAQAATWIGRTAIDTAPPNANLSGYRRLDLRFLAQDGSVLDPHPYFELWGLISGPMVQGHPLLDLFETDVKPAVAPLEGAIRIRVLGTGFVAGTTVEVGGQAATEVRPAADGNSVYATAPALPEGPADIVVTAPGQASITYSGGIRYVSDTTNTTRAALASYAVLLQEMILYATALDAQGDLDAVKKGQIGYTIDLAGNTLADRILVRSQGGGGPWRTPEAAEISRHQSEFLRPLVEAARATVR